MRSHSYLNTAARILSDYQGGEPFSSTLKKFFSKEKRYGSADRRNIGHLCYCFFRLGKSFTDTIISDRIVYGLFLCSRQPDWMLAELNAPMNDHVTLTVPEKFKILGHDQTAASIFPWSQELSDHIDPDTFRLSFLLQPDLFLRLRPGQEQQVQHKLQQAAVDFVLLRKDCLSLSNSSKIDILIMLDREAVVQDYSSQRTGDILGQLENRTRKDFSAWDCCAGSGGKSLLLFDRIPNVRLTVSDIRPSILTNLKKRFTSAGIKNYTAYVADVANPQKISDIEAYDLVLCDAPCTGSGTWARTPEQLYFFDQAIILKFAELQKRILSQVSMQVKNGGYLLYITCSVFRKENEEVASFAANNIGLSLVSQEMIVGYEQRADTMFLALFKKKL